MYKSSRSGLVLRATFRRNTIELQSSSQTEHACTCTRSINIFLLENSLSTNSFVTVFRKLSSEHCSLQTLRATFSCSSPIIL